MLTVHLRSSVSTDVGLIVKNGFLFLCAKDLVVHVVCDSRSSAAYSGDSQDSEIAVVDC